MLDVEHTARASTCPVARRLHPAVMSSRVKLEQSSAPGLTKDASGVLEIRRQISW